MTEQADILRKDRRRFAWPGGSHDRLVAVLARFLPALIGVVVALMIFTPLAPRGEVSFILDRNKVAIAEDRLRVQNAMYRGEDEKGRPFSLTAGEAVQQSARVPVVRMRDLQARILLSEGPALLSAEAGEYDFETQKVAINGLVQFSAADGYRASARDVAIDLEKKTLVGEGRVEGAIPAGTFSANRIVANLDERTIMLDGNARLHMEPGKLRMP
ncbi:hypothetical protein SZ64_14620 [Erythrobacter sp. SG61-1L]|uniref:hypothetical protein n=1 Tax=Erythrobacter sp. SG61-1L TaxID=1603897 RepID=UPI0006C8FE78|nr:hypothetical protein [Erythrobacter sp. SG61-1L]KPL69228.1 hypothetical protein SZ64_14620 [Erythrobacter sp. SG61-1L]